MENWKFVPHKRGESSIDRHEDRDRHVDTLEMPVLRGEHERSTQAEVVAASTGGNRETRGSDSCSMCFGWTRGCFVLSKRRNIHPRNWTFNVRLKAFWLAYTPLPEEEERVESAPFARGRGSRASRSEKSPVKKRRTLPKIYTRCVGKIPGPRNETPGIDVPADLLNRGRIGCNNCKLVEYVSDTHSERILKMIRN